MSVIVVTLGTGTDVGKTHVTAALGAHLLSRKLRVRAWKPVASGAVGMGEDAAVLARAVGGTAIPPLYSFRDPVSAHLAARREGKVIDLSRIVERVLTLARGCEVLLVETAGGLFSPLSSEHTNADLVGSLGEVRTLLVAPDRIGVLHDVRATLLAAQAEGLRLRVVVLSSPGVSDATTGTNADELEATGAAWVSATFPKAKLGAEATHQAAEAAWSALSAE